MKTLVTAFALAAVAGCMAPDWNADDNQVGWTGDVDPTSTPAAATHADPVTGERVGSDSQWTATHEGKTYYFASEDNLRKFQENPGQYADVR